MSIMDPIELGPLTLRPIDTQATGGHITIKLITADGEPDCWTGTGSGWIEVPLVVWERAQRSRTDILGVFR